MDDQRPAGKRGLKFSIRDLMWLTVVVALIIAFLIYHARYNKLLSERNEYESANNNATHQLVKLQEAFNKYQLQIMDRENASKDTK